MTARSPHQPDPPALAAVRVHGVTRSAFIARGALAAGAVFGAAAVGPFVREALAQAEDLEGAGDVRVLNFALTLEHIEATFYERALGDVGLDGDLRALAEELAANEREHVDFLVAEIRRAGGRPVGAPEVDFGTGLSGSGGFLKLAEDLEETGVAAYNGAANDLQSDDLLAKLVRVAQVEGRHAALIKLERDKVITPNGALDGSLGADEARTRLGQYVIG